MMTIAKDTTKTYVKKERNSNIELMRIISMALVILSHYALSSGIIDCFGTNITPNMLLLQSTVILGGLGMNSFMLVTGYFSIKSKFRIVKWLHLYLEIIFYRFMCNLVFVFSYTEEFDFNYIFKSVFQTFFQIDYGYSSTITVVYLLIPFFNKLVVDLPQKIYLRFLAILMFVYTILPTIIVIHDRIYWIGWMIVCYFIGGYIRLYPCKFFASKPKQVIMFLTSFLLGFASIVAIDCFGERIGLTNWQQFVYFANKLFPCVAGIALFLFFLNLKVKQNKIINTIAASTFGVLCIHGSNRIMRKFLWRDLFHNVDYYNSPFMILHMLMAMLVIYIVCTFIDMLRIRFVEKPFFAWLDKYTESISIFFEKIESKITGFFYDV